MKKSETVKTSVDDLRFIRLNLSIDILDKDIDRVNLEVVSKTINDLKSFINKYDNIVTFSKRNSYNIKVNDPYITDAIDVKIYHTLKLLEINTSEKDISKAVKLLIAKYVKRMKFLQKDVGITTDEYEILGR